MSNLVRRFSSLLTIAFSAGIALMPANAATSNGLRPHALSAELQIRQANVLWEKVHQATSEQVRLEATRATWDCLVAIPDLWPEDVNAVVQSGVMRYELAMESNAVETAIESLLSISDLARKTVLATDVERRLGEAYMIVGDRENAERHFLQAEVSLNSETTAIEASAVLRSVADFYARQKNSAEAIKRLDRGAQLRNQSLVAQIQFRLSSAREALNLPVEVRSETATRELTAVDELIATSRSKPLSAMEAENTESYAREAGQLRERLSR